MGSTTPRGGSRQQISSPKLDASPQVHMQDDHRHASLSPDAPQPNVRIHNDHRNASPSRAASHPHVSTQSASPSFGNIPETHISIFGAADAPRSKHVLSTVSA